MRFCGAVRTQETKYNANERSSKRIVDEMRGNSAQHLRSSAAICVHLRYDLLWNSAARSLRPTGRDHRAELLAPSLCSPAKPLGEAGCHTVFRGRESGEAAAFLGEARPIGGIIHVGQPQNDRPQSSLSLGGAVAGDPIAGGGWACVHALQVTPVGRGFNGIRFEGLDRPLDPTISLCCDS